VGLRRKSYDQREIEVEYQGLRTDPEPLRWLAPRAGQAVSLIVLALLLGWLVIGEMQRSGPARHIVWLGLSGLALAAGWVPPTIRDTRFAHAFGYVFMTAGALGLAALGYVEASATAVTAVVFLASVAWRTPVSATLLVVCTAAFDVVAVSRLGFVATALFPNLLWAYIFFGGRVLRRWRIDQRRAQAALAEHAEAAAMRERARITKDIHDVLGHNLSMLAVQLETARVLLPRDSESSEARRQIESAGKLARHGLEELAEVVGTLRADAVPWLTRIGELIAAFERDTGVRCHLTVEGDDATVPADAQITAYRALQEALTNAHKHSSASEVRVHLRCTDEELGLCVVNDGVDPEHAPTRAAAGAGYGLDSTRERAELMGGSLEAGVVDGRYRLHLRLPR
jgi:signal transduction histidine kinase